MSSHDPVDRPLRHLRIVTAIGVIAISIPAALDLRPVALVPLVAGVVVFTAAFAESSLRNCVGRRKASVATLAFDLVAVLLALIIADVDVGQPESLALALPLIAAGIRHAVLGVVVMWAISTFTIVAQLVATWDGTPGQAGDPLQLCVALIAIALPCSQLSQHAAERARSFVAAQRALEPSPMPLGTGPQSLAALLAEPDFDHMVFDRQGITDRLAERLLQGPVSVALVGLDDVKLLTDLHGRSTGDALIGGTVDRLSVFGSAADVAWIGGDELLLVTEASDDLASFVRTTLDEPIDLGAAGRTNPQVAVGAVTGSPDNTAAQLIRAVTESMIADRREQNAKFIAQFDSLVFELSTEAAVLR